MTFLYSSYIYSPMKFSLKSFLPSSLFNKITLKAAILVGLVIFYLVIMFSSSREGVETQQPMDSSEPTTPTPSKKATVTATATATPTPTPSKKGTPTPSTMDSPTMASPTMDSPSTMDTIENLESPSKTPYATY
jgi:cytoskeletal protein RodZ